MTIIQDIEGELDHRGGLNTLKRRIQDAILLELRKPEYAGLYGLDVSKTLSELSEMFGAGQRAGEKISAAVPA